MALKGRGPRPGRVASPTVRARALNGNTRHVRSPGRAACGKLVRARPGGGALWRAAVLSVAVTAVGPGVAGGHAAQPENRPRPAARSQSERIALFRSEVVVHPDGRLTVTETIRVYAAGKKIKRGIYRDFPTRYPGPLGLTVEVPFRVLGVERDGQREAYHTERRGNGVRVYMGRADVLVPRGWHTYVLRYETDEQLGFFADHDELYWNVTGNGWEFAIEKAEAVVILPEGVPPEKIRVKAYTGPQGAKGRDYSAQVQKDRPHVRFETTRSLRPREGLTIVVGWPKGHVKPPEAADRWWALLRHNRPVLVGLIGLVVVLAYYLMAWWRVGRDPRRGTIVPLFEPPLNMSPACIRYVWRMGFDDKCLTAAILDLAVRGLLTIHEEGGKYVLRRRKVLSEYDGRLPSDERALAKKLLSRSEVELVQSNHSFLQSARERLQRRLRAQYYGKAFVTNRVWMVPGLLLTLAVIALCALVNEGKTVEFLFLTVWLSVWTLAVVALATGVVSAWRSVFAARGSGGAAAGVGQAVFLTAFALPFFGGEVMGIVFLVAVASWLMITLFAALLGVNVVFAYLLPRPTAAGRKLLDLIEGFRMYLAAAEAHYLQTMHPPDRTPELFEKYLPYALALDVENEWAEQFADVLERATVEDESGRHPYRPHWYHGRAWGTRGFAASTFAGGLGSGFTSAISSASVAPGSSSGFSGGGGGGSSGGGGGGGGGGGW